MALINYVVLFMSYFLLWVWTQEITSNGLRSSVKPMYSQQLEMFLNINESDNNETVKVQLYYECLCIHCVHFDSHAFRDAVIKLGNYLDIHTYPYGNAKTIFNNGKVDFNCQHGPVECYGNKLHSCALDIITNNTEALLFNSCMMDSSRSSGRSDDLAADVCAASMKLDSEEIKKCAKEERGTQLLKCYGEESRKVSYKHVPYILVNGKVSSEETFIADICHALTNPPPECR